MLMKGFDSSQGKNVLHSFIIVSNMIVESNLFRSLMDFAFIKKPKEILKERLDTSKPISQITY